MKRTIPSMLVVLALAVPSVPAQAPPSGQKTLAATMSVYVFPSAGQTPEQQSKDESECYNWAVQNTGTDPFELSKATEQAKAQTQQNTEAAKAGAKGGGARGAVGGAAAGALIGEIASDDAGEGAAIGAAAGAIAGRRRSAKAQQQAAQQGQAQTQQIETSSKEAMDGFRKAFAVCLEAKKYMVKY